MAGAAVSGAGDAGAAESRREAVARARRIVVKVGSSSLTQQAGANGASRMLDPARLGALVEALAPRLAAGAEIVLVSSGAIAAGLEPLSLAARPRDLATQQAAASVGQGLLVAHYTAAFARHGRAVGQVLLTAEDVSRRTHYRNAHRTLTRLLALGVVPVVNENDTVATQEIRFGDNDRLAALVAQLVDADLLVLLSDVDALYDRDPRQPGAVRLTEVAPDDDLSGVDIAAPGAAGVGTGGMVTKVEAARIATAAGVPVVLAAADSAPAALAGEPVGTYFVAGPRRRSSRLLWLAHATAPTGRLILDEGAVRAVTQRGASLLAAGVRAVEGRFSAGDAVDLVDEVGSVVARGLVAYDASELPALLGRRTSDLSRDLGKAYEREVVHRDDLVVLAAALPAAAGPEA